VELVGRDGELRAVARAFDDVRDGGARVLAVLGEAGIGKSALLAAIAEQARASARPALLVLEGRAAEHERDLPFAVAIDALDEHVASLHPSRIAALDGELGAILPAATSSEARVGCDRDPVERFRYLRALRGLLELLGRERPFALLLDDLHWSDDMSLEFVLHVLRRPPAVPHLIAFALRPGTSTGRLLDAARGAPGFEQLALAPLRHDESLGLLADVREPAVRERLAREAGGNPLYLRELARVADRPGGGLPATVVAAVGVEIAALPSAARTLIEGAAVTGDPFDPELAAAPPASSPMRPCWIGS
jgi:predicted ATPase